MAGTDDSILRTENLSVAYGGVRALDNVDLEVNQATLVGLIGPNGAGKTTLIDALTGFAPTTSGRVHFAGTDISTLRPHTRARMGLARTFQSLELFNDLTVLENVQVAAAHGSWRHTLANLVWPARDDTAAAALHALEQADIAELRDSLPTELSQGQRKLVGVARALVSQPKILLLDEPAAGLDTRESQSLGTRLRSMVDTGSTMLLIDHDMGLVLKFCDTIYVLEFGKVIAHGNPAEIRNDPRVIAAYLGESGLATDTPAAP